MRRLVVLVLTLVVVIGSPFGILAQDATPGAMGPSLLSQAGLPELHLTIADGALQAPAEIAAGEVLVVLDNQLEFPAGITFIKFPEGTTDEEMMMILGPPPEAEAGASPVAEGGEEEMGPPPPLFYEMTWGGGVFAVPGAPGEVVVTLTPGEWVMAADPESGVMPVKIQVTGEMEAPADVAADAEVELKNFQFVFPEQINAGQQVWKVTNSGDQPHEMFIVKTPRRLTLDEAQILLELPEDELPPEGVPNPAEFEDVGGVAPISKDQTVHFEMNLEPGAYVAICFMPDKDSGMPHALKGMVVIFEVPEEGASVEPPVSPVPEEEHEMATPTS
jgi:hypothetical protein